MKMLDLVVWIVVLVFFSELSVKCAIGFGRFVLDLQYRNYWISNNFVEENSMASKQIFLREMGGALLVVLKSPWWEGFPGANFVIFRPLVWDVLDFMNHLEG